MNQLVIGAGEIGLGLGKVLEQAHSVFYIDTQKNICTLGMGEEYEILHICIPGTLSNFIQIVQEYQTKFRPRLTIIHSTVVPGVTRKIGGEVVHSPVRGKHPDMAAHIQVYAKHFGILQPGSWYYSMDLIKKVFEPCGIKCIYHESPEETELGKILELFRYGMEIYMATYQKNLCDLYEVDYSTVTRFIETYNDGLEKVGYPQYKQPTISPMPGNRLGGHCVIENCYELYKNVRETDYPSLLYKLILFGQGDRDLL